MCLILIVLLSDAENVNDESISLGPVIAAFFAGMVTLVLIGLLVMTFICKCRKKDAGTAMTLTLVK